MQLHWIATFGVVAQRVFAAGLFLLGMIASYFGWIYGLGQLNDVGPGAFPFGLGILLMALSLQAGLESGTVRTQVRFAPVFFVPVGIAVWALLIERAGLLVATFVLIGFCGLATGRFRPLFLAFLALVLTFAGYLVFVLGFKLPLTLFGGS